MRTPIRLVIFDLGSTLIHENGPWDSFFPRANQALWNALQQAGVTLGPRDLFGEYAGLFDLYYELHRNDLNEPSAAVVLDELLRNKGFSMPKDSVRGAMRAMFAVTQENWLPETDAIPTLQTLKQGGLRIGLISNASDDDNTQALIDKGGFRPYLEYIVSSAGFGKRKPHPDIFRSALDHFGIAAEQAVMVGDDYEADIRGARGVGMQSIWVTRRIHGTLPEKRQSEATIVVASLGEIPPLLIAT